MHNCLTGLTLLLSCAAQEMEIETAEEVAVVGIGCNFPGGDGIDNFWKVLEEGKNCTVEIPPERFNAKEWYDPDDNKPGKICTTRAALLDEFNSFDNHLFGINNMEAERMDPQQKLLIECTYKALEDAGVPVESVSGTRTGVFIGKMKLSQQRKENLTKIGALLHNLSMLSRLDLGWI
ncbi:PREDICTED: putative uncharacterized protein encoded by LINC00614 [Corvus brachyrhynchos]|uniref:putative uncharacterized protein encoded by LINC00614 n=1 Tax=Corvus brachyrhynchos TaxID=85066 RepID=UPI0008167948|nr:PREDICTED: putative uncharacterized protein encoded by LINC00614 [Corvus brachyrhynchos]